MAETASRVDWVDTAKGICIIFVVMMHSTLGVGNAMGGEGFMHTVVDFARPFRMPDFFLISGLFLGLVINRPWLRYLDRKVVHFVYFYILWLTIQFVFKAPGMAMENGIGAAAFEYLYAFVQPFGTLWFIYILPIFFVVTRLVKGLPVWFVLGWAAVLEILPVSTGILVFDEFCARYVYFFAGYAFATHIFDLAAWAQANKAKAVGLLGLWAVVNAVMVFTPAPALMEPILHADEVAANSQGLAALPILSLIMGAAGAIAIVTVSALLTSLSWMRWLSWLGAHSIVVYLAFFLPMAVARVVLIRLGIITDIGVVAFLVTASAVAGPVILYGLVQYTGYGRFLFERPDWAYLDRAGTAADGRQPHLLT
ncbi:acyltransferase family protein [Mesorhizobium sp. CAU 1741]|uniref:acyltransferase family protein n=1 Tax=Mesorhizobium sp. CAU 1741 TaxID=3140366 RepID=UPI00325C29C0